LERVVSHHTSFFTDPEMSLMMNRVRCHGVALLVLALGTAAMLADASSRRAAQGRRAAEVEAAVRLLGTADLALSSASRWLRHPSLSEPGAAFADAPALLDADPAGALIGPPFEVSGPGAGGTAGRTMPWRSR